MLRAIITDLASEQTWILQGRLCKTWAAELKKKWESTRSTRIGRSCSIDLEDVSWVDVEGESVLLEMMKEGAVLVVKREYMRHVVEGLKARAA